MRVDTLLRQAIVQALADAPGQTERPNPKFAPWQLVNGSSGQGLTIVGLQWTSLEEMFEEQRLPGWNYYCKTQSGADFIEHEFELELAEEVAGGVA